MSPFVPFVSIEIEPRTRVDRENLDHGLRTLMAEDPTVSAHSDRQTGSATIFGVGELQLQIVVDRLTREFDVEAEFGQPRVAYKETLTREADGDGRYAAQIDGCGQYGHVKIHVSPGQAGSGYRFTNAVVGGSMPNAFIKPIEDGIRDALTRGVLFGFPIDDVRIELYDGSYHDVDSSAATFQIAGARAFQDAAKRAGPVLLEPVVRVEVVAPKDCIDGVAEDLASRRGGQVQSPEDRSGAAFVAARVPFSEMLGYATDLRSRTRGRATYSITLEGFEPRRGGPGRDEGDRGAPVRVPRPPRPTGKDTTVALPGPERESSESDR
jgi:elongation factor G